MKDLRIEKLADNLINYSVKLQKGEKILIDVIGEDGMPLAKELMRKASEVGGIPFVNITNYEIQKIMLENLTEEQIKLYGEMELEKMKKMDAYIGIRASTNIAELVDIDSEKLNLYSKYYTSPVHFEERCSKKWCILRYPNASMAQLSNMSTEKFEDFFFEVCNLDYSKMSKAMDPLVELMNKTDKVHIVGDKVDLRFSIKGIGATKCVGDFNIPDGEVFTAPVKDSVNGYIEYNTASRYDGIKFNNIRFEFENGKIVKAMSSNNQEELNKLLDTDEGSRYIGEFALGVNPYVYLPIDDTLFDEKINGSFHFTPGDSIEESDNGNRSAIHWDIVNIQRKEFGGGEIYFDDVLVRKDGLFVLEELKPLNPESLK